jgi:hypothetical protein
VSEIMTTFKETVTVRITLADAYDGILRVLIDAQRLGLELVALDLQPGQKARCMTMTVSSAARIDGRRLVIRFARHPAVARVDVKDEPDRDHFRADDTGDAVVA